MNIINLKLLTKKIFGFFGIQIIKNSTYIKLIKLDKFNIFQFFKEINANWDKFLKYLPHSKSQNGQDLLALDYLNYKKEGYFVEVGAANGVYMSNTYLMEKKFNWKGILAEPAKIYQQELRDNRSVNIEASCVWKKTGERLLFNETTSGITSTIHSFTDSDFNKRIVKTKYEVKTISLSNLLKKYNAPKNIDYLSIDTEGSEFEILKNFNFNTYNISIIMCEHNFNKKKRNDIYKLLTKNKFVRKYEDFSQYDDWYFKY